MQRVLGPCFWPEKRTKVTEGCGKCGVPGIFLTGLRQVWNLLRRTPT